VRNTIGGWGTHGVQELTHRRRFGLCFFEQILKEWEEKDIFKKTLAKLSPKGEFVFYDGPPTANGIPHIGHVETRAFKDIIPRFKTMQGFHVERKAGWDTQGLP